MSLYSVLQKGHAVPQWDPTLKPGESTGPYFILSNYLDLPTLDHYQWWHYVSPMLEKLFANASYDIHQQYQYMLFWGRCVIPMLGPFPSLHSELYGDIIGGIGSLEVSQNFAMSNCTVRLQFEPVSYNASTGSDPYNRFSMDLALNRLKRIGIPLDLQLYHQLVPLVTLTDDEEATIHDRMDLQQGPGKSQVMLGLDLKGADMLVKVYFNPYIKSIVTGEAVPALLFTSIQKIDHDGLFTGPLNMIKDYVTNEPVTSRTLSIACDLLAIRTTRFKFYFAETYVNFESVTRIWTLQGRRHDPETMKGLQLLQGLWHDLHIPEGHHQPLIKKIQPGDPATVLPILFNLEARPNILMPTPKIYIPVAGIPDSLVAAAVTKFFEQNGLAKYARSYTQNLKSYVPGVDVDESENLQIWLSFAYSEKAGPALTVYYH